MESTIDKKKEYQKSKIKQSFLGLGLTTPYLIIFIIFSLVPVFSGIVMSFMNYNPYDLSNNEFIGLKNYIDLFKGLGAASGIPAKFWQSFLSTFLFDLIAIPFLIIIPLALAYLINLNPPCYKIFRAIIYLPSVISVTIMGIIFSNIFASDSSGLINSIFHVDIKWLSGGVFKNDTLRWIVMLIASIWWQTGTNFVIFSGALRDVPKSLYEACEADGANRFKLFKYVTLPNIKSSIGICLFNTLIGYLNLYGQPAVLKDVTNENDYFSPMQYIQRFLSQQTYVTRKTGYICACAVIFGLIVMAFSIIERKLMSGRKRKNIYTDDFKRYQKNINNSLINR